MPSLFLVLFGTIVALSIVDAGVRARLFKRLRKNHPVKYDAMGRPSVFVVRYGATSALFGFLVFRDHVLLKDQAITRLADALLALRIFIVFAVLASFLLEPS